MAHILSQGTSKMSTFHSTTCNLKRPFPETSVVPCLFAVWLILYAPSFYFSCRVMVCFTRGSYDYDALTTPTGASTETLWSLQMSSCACWLVGSNWTREINESVCFGIDLQPVATDLTTATYILFSSFNDVALVWSAQQHGYELAISFSLHKSLYPMLLFSCSLFLSLELRAT